jgi:hypothetical protein
VYAANFLSRPEDTVDPSSVTGLLPGLIVLFCTVLVLVQLTHDAISPIADRGCSAIIASIQYTRSLF